MGPFLFSSFFCLFRFSKMSNFIIKAAYTHGMNLAKFVGVFKTLLYLFKTTIGGGKELPFHHFIAGCIGGYVVFKEENAINTQIILYLFSRVCFAMAKGKKKFT